MIIIEMRSKVNIKVAQNGERHSITRCIQTPNLGYLPQIIFEIWPGMKALLTDRRTDRIEQTYSPKNRSSTNRGLIKDLTEVLMYC